MSFSSDRRFRIWDYNVSHDQLLLRNPRSPEIFTNIDVMFWGVEYLDIPTMLVGLADEKTSGDDLADAHQRLPKIYDPSDIHTIISEGKKYFVVAVGFQVLRNELDIFESNLEYFREDTSTRDLGEVLAHS